MPPQVVCPNPLCRNALSVQNEQADTPLRCPVCNTELSPPSADKTRKPTTVHSSVKRDANEGSLTRLPAPTSQAQAPKAARKDKDELPTTIGPYPINRELGRGAFGVVYQGHDPKLKRDLAIKVLKKDALKSAKAVERFLREAQLVAQMHHNNIVPVYELGEHDGCHYIASRFIPGQSLADLIPEKGMKPNEAVKLAVQLLDALAYAHEMNILHRDVKPANAIVGTNGHLYLTDFGLAGWLGQTEERLTQDGTVMGTPAYMPPEQARGTIHLVCEASDQYSAGVVLYELLTGRVPFEGAPLLVILHNVIHTPPPRPSEFRPGLDRELEAIYLRALAKKPEDRYPSCQAFAETLRNWRAGSLSAAVVLSVAETPTTAKPVKAEVVAEQKPARRTTELQRKRKTAKKSMSSTAKPGGPQWLWLVGIGGAAGLLLLAVVLIIALATRTPRGEADKSSPEKQQQTARYGSQPTEVWTNQLGMKFARVPAGNFWMGGGGGSPGDKQVTISNDFYLGVYPVTQGEWRMLMGDTNPAPSFFARKGPGVQGMGWEAVKSLSNADLDRLPVEQISWDDAQEFIKRLNKRDPNSNWVYRLPSETEWEYACRGASSAKEDCSFHFYFKEPTNDLSADKVNFKGSLPVGRTTKVGSYEPNCLGLYDMHGNVWQWCSDVQAPGHVYRGGSWAVAGVESRAANRRISPTPTHRYCGIGFRVARVPAR